MNLTAMHLREPHTVTADTEIPTHAGFQALLDEIAGDRRECYPYRTGQLTMMLTLAIGALVRAKRHIARLEADLDAVEDHRS